MALITCPECGKEISDQAPACPSCGYPLSPAQPDAPPLETPPATKPEPPVPETPSDQPAPLSLQTPTAETKARNKKILFGIAAAVVAVILIFALVYVASSGRESQKPDAPTESTPAEAGPVALQFWERDQEKVLDAISQRIQDQTFFPDQKMTVLEKEEDGQSWRYILVNGKATVTMLSFMENANTGNQDLFVICASTNDEDSLAALVVAASAVFCECDAEGNFPTMYEGKDALSSMTEIQTGETITKTIGGVCYRLAPSNGVMIFKAEKPT